mmetsp:Transcript_39560/g.64158  ORF Transcript_39560/g.64158 Transcript_39560/m.64158 type:complete len:487 (+) Transcript_39560:1092-2552(+)
MANRERRAAFLVAPCAFIAGTPVSHRNAKVKFATYKGFRRQCMIDGDSTREIRREVSSRTNDHTSRVVFVEASVSAPSFTTGVKRNANLAKLKAGYLFPEISRRRAELLKRKPDAKIISLGIGDTTLPIAPHISKALQQQSERLASKEGYSGYGPEQGIPALRQKIAETYYPNDLVKAEEIFVSDGSKCDIARLQMMFGSDVSIAVQDPSYPVYVDTSVMMGSTGDLDDVRAQYRNIVYMTCTPENSFFPDLPNTPRTDIIFFCSPNNPTGAVATKEQLKQLVDFAIRNKSIIVFDAAYSAYIEDSSLARSIYEIPGARQVAIETNSFSKSAGFTGVRLGWTIVPNDLKYSDGTPVRNDFNRVMTTCFNGASNVAQYGGLACLDPVGLEQIQEQVNYYNENAKILRDAFTGMGFKVYGGLNAPYVWVQFPGKQSWDMFSEILEKANVVCTPGSGFGPAGEGFIRFSAFGQRNDIYEAIERIKTNVL